MTPAQMYQQGMKAQSGNPQAQRRLLAQMLKNGGIGAQMRTPSQQTQNYAADAPNQLNGSMIPRMDTQPQAFQQGNRPANSIAGAWNNPMNRMREYAAQQNQGFAVGEPNPSAPRMPQQPSPVSRMPKPIPRPASPPIMPNPNLPQTMY